MKLSKSWLLPCVPLVLAACGKNETDSGENGPGYADTAAAATEPGAHAGAGAGGMAPQMIFMREVGGSGVTGEATLTEEAGQTGVAVRLTGFQPNTAHSGHVHQGTCESLGAPVAPLQDVQADDAGQGTATSTVAIPGAVAMNGEHSIAYHQAAGENIGPPVVCGTIPHHAM